MLGVTFAPTALLLPALALRATEDLWWRALLRALQALPQEGERREHT